MKTIGIIGAMDIEVKHLRESMEISSVKQIIGIEFYKGIMSGKNVVVVCSRVGKVNAAICCQILIDLYGVDYIVNTGVAGGLYKELKLGDIVISRDVVLHDFDTTALGDPMGVNTSIYESVFQADNELVHIAFEACKQVLKEHKAYVGRISTGDQFISDDDSKKIIWSNFKSYCVEMEGGAIGQTCYLNKIPFVIIRSISDEADKDSHITFTKFVRLAAANSISITKAMIQQI